jgi:AbrB family looped-hinge helix DNA binding protein
LLSFKTGCSISAFELRAFVGKNLYRTTLLRQHAVDMAKVRLSSKFQIVIPRDVREKLNLKAGEQIVMVEKAGIIHLVPQKPIKQMRGFVKGGDTRDIRDEEDRF